MRMPPLGGDPDTITLSGMSAGSYMSNTLHLIMSDTIKGVGLYEGGPYGTNLYDQEGTQTNW